MIACCRGKPWADGLDYALDPSGRRNHGGVLGFPNKLAELLGRRSKPEVPAQVGRSSA
jgi:hypothetical protein